MLKIEAYTRAQHTQTSACAMDIRVNTNACMAYYRRYTHTGTNEKK